MSSAAAVAAGELEQQTYAIVRGPDELPEALDVATAAWEALFQSSEKFLLPGDVTVPSGYIPLCQPAGCEMKESFYMRPEIAPPARVAEPARRLAAILADVAVAVAAEVGEAAGRELIRVPAGGCLRVMRYPAFADAPEAELMQSLEAHGMIRTIAHTDLNALTILPASTAPGLELRLDGDWVELEVGPADLLVHAGQELEARSDGRWRATEHRVRNPRGPERSLTRMAFALFVS